MESKGKVKLVISGDFSVAVTGVEGERQHKTTSFKINRKAGIQKKAFSPQLPTGNGDKQSVLCSWSLCTWTNCFWEKTACLICAVWEWSFGAWHVVHHRGHQSSFPVVTGCARPCLPGVELHLEALDRIHTLCHTAMTHREAERKRDANQHGQHNSHPPE